MHLIIFLRNSTDLTAAAKMSWGRLTCVKGSDADNCDFDGDNSDTILFMHKRSNWREWIGATSQSHKSGLSAVLSSVCYLRCPQFAPSHSQISRLKRLASSLQVYHLIFFSLIFHVLSLPSLHCDSLTTIYHPSTPSPFLNNTWATHLYIYYHRNTSPCHLTLSPAVRYDFESTHSITMNMLRLSSGSNPRPTGQSQDGVHVPGAASQGFLPPVAHTQPPRQAMTLPSMNVPVLPSSSTGIPQDDQIQPNVIDPDDLRVPAANSAYPSSPSVV